MKRFLKRYLFFTFIALTMLATLDIILSSRLKKSPERTFAAWYDLMAGTINADLIVLGSSRAWVQYSPEILDTILCVNSYNLGIDGSCLNRQITKYNLFRYYNQTPQVILINVDYFCFGYTHGYESYQYFPFFYRPIVRDVIFPQEHFSLAERYLPFYRYSHLGINNFLNGDRCPLYKGYHGMQKEWDGIALRKIEPFKIKFDEMTLKLFDSFLSQTQEEGVQVVFVFAPIYYQVNNLVLNMDEFTETVSDYSDKYQIPTLFYNNIDICYDSTFFYNATHLNRRGAELFSTILGNDLKQMGLVHN